MHFRSSVFVAAFSIFAASLWSAPLARAQAHQGQSTAHRAALPTLTMHKSPGCLCCDKWVEIAKAEGFKVEVIESSDMTGLKQRAGVPLAKISCHTTTAGGYFFEGHVPLDLVRKVLETRPALAGLLAPGMPQSAPGMDDGRRPHQPYQVLALSRDGKLTPYALR